MTTTTAEARPQTKPELLLAAFTPSIMSAETLEAIFVRREPLAAAAGQPPHQRRDPLQAPCSARRTARHRQDSPGQPDLPSDQA